jgi:hypothetical protein
MAALAIRNFIAVSRRSNNELRGYGRTHLPCPQRDDAEQVRTTDIARVRSERHAAEKLRRAI